MLGRTLFTNVLSSWEEERKRGRIKNRASFWTDEGKKDEREGSILGRVVPAVICVMQRPSGVGTEPLAVGRRVNGRRRRSGSRSGADWHSHQGSHHFHLLAVGRRRFDPLEQPGRLSMLRIQDEALLQQIDGPFRFVALPISQCT